MNTALFRTTLIASLASAALLPMAGCDTVGPLVLQSSDQTAEGYEVLAREWVRWASLIPYSESPINDPTGELCSVGQSDGLWFLAATYGGPAERDCTIPRNTALFFPLLNSYVIPDDAWVEAGNYDYYVNTLAPTNLAKNRANTCELTLRIDGEDLLEDTAERDAELWVALTEPFSVELDDDNWWTNLGYVKPGGTYNYALVGGHWALFKPLSPGEHTLEFGGKVCSGDAVIFETSVIYHLHVQGKHHGHH